MDPAIWSLLPMEILEMILLWVPFSTLIRFASTSKHFQALLWQRAFRTSWLNNHIAEVGFFVEVWRPYEIEILYKFINSVGHTSFLHITNPENNWTIECTSGSNILLSRFFPLPGHKSYSIINPFERRFLYIGVIEI